jgi:hypothetical protein
MSVRIPAERLEEFKRAVLEATNAKAAIDVIDKS